MRSRFSAAMARAAIIAFLGGSVAVIPATAGVVSAKPAARAKVYLTAFQTQPSTGWTSKTFNPFLPVNDDFTSGAIYQPLMVITQASGKGTKTYPFLATGYSFSNHNKTLKVKLRHGVRWSDGKPFTSADVVFTYNYTKAHGIDQTCFSSSCPGTVSAAGRYAVVFHFRSTVATGVQALLSGGSYVLPQHVWSSVSSPTTFTNPNPVGTGPFTQVQDFSSAQYILGKNPYSWIKVHYDGIKVPAYKSNADALGAFESHQVDWAPINPGIAESKVVATDPKHLHYFDSPPTPPLDMEFNEEVYPFNQVALREAISMSIKRDDISRKAELGSELPSDAFGIKFLWPDWIDHKWDKLDKKLSAYDPSAARKLLTTHGFHYVHGTLYANKNDKPVQLTVACPFDFSDWVIAVQIVANDLRAGIGLDANADTSLQDGDFFTGRANRTFSGPATYVPNHDYAMFGTEGSGQTPYQFFWSFMSKQAYYPVGSSVVPNGSWDQTGWTSGKATRLLKSFQQTSSLKAQHKIADQIQAIQATNLPIIPTVTQAIWYNYSTLHFSGWPTKKNYYAYAAGYTYPDDALVIARLRPNK